MRRFILFALASCAARSPRGAGSSPRGAVPCDVVEVTDTPVQQGVRTQSEPLRGVVRVVMQGPLGCAVRDDGRVACWQGGAETWSASGVFDPRRANPVAATLVPGLTGVTDLCLATHTLCAWRRDGTIRCRTAVREEPTGEATTPGPAARVIEEDLPGAGYVRGFLRIPGCWMHRADGAQFVVRVPDHPLYRFRVSPAESAGFPTCAITDGIAQCSGNNHRGVIANLALPRVPATSPRALHGMRAVQSVAVRDDHGCAARHDGTVWCWGRNLEGQLGTGDRRSRALPSLVPGLDGVVGVAVGLWFSCALRASGEVRCWGINRRGELADGTTRDRVAPSPVVDLPAAAEVFAVNEAACARTREGGVWCWGPYAHPEGIVPRPREIFAAPE